MTAVSRQDRELVDDRPLAERMRAYGCPDLIPLHALSRPEQIEYLDLLPLGRATARLDAVAEHQGTALLYLLDGCARTRVTASDVVRLQRRLANRSDPAWLGVSCPGSLELYPVGFHEEVAAAPLRIIREENREAPFFFQSLVHGSFDLNDKLHGSDYVFQKIYGLLEQTIEEYVETDEPRVPPLDVLSMAGRALFFRFLVDRKIVRDGELPDICPAADGLKDTFADAEKAAQTSAWLDETFNGDFLQLIDESIPAEDRADRQHAYLRYYKRVTERAGRCFFRHLDAILNGWKEVGGGFQTEIDWGDLDFAYIPVGVLSQVYESFSHRADRQTAQETSVHYTPRNVARLMVNQVFGAVKDPNATVLDPTCGAGIFLVLCFRRLVSAYWANDPDGKRPDTRTIQKILYEQLRGFDVSESALRLAALSLYITAIEVNGSPRPPKSLKFPRDLRNTVLYHFGDVTQGDVTQDDAARGQFVLGSLGPDVPERFNGAFDVVLGNPPWTRLRERELQRTEGARTNKKARTAGTEQLNEAFTAIGRRVLEARGFPELAQAYENPDKNPDVPFVWRATEWAKDDGAVALALPARIFSRTSKKGAQAWRAVLRSVCVNGLINGSDLRKTPVWDSMDMPFCLVFMKNAVPREDHRFHYAAPAREPKQNGHARFRIDYEATHPVSVDDVETKPWILKTLAFGTWRDVRLMEDLLKVFPEDLETRWEAWNPDMDKTGQGYNRSPKLKQEPAEFLDDLPDFERPSEGFSIPVESKTYLEKYGDKGSSDEDGHATAHMPRTELLYQPPLVIVPKSPGDDPGKAKAFLSSRSIAFSQINYGYSCAEHPAAKTLAALLYITVHSTLFRYFVLMTSVSQGADRMMFTKQDLDHIPFPDVSELSAADKATVRKLARRLEQDEDKPWDDVDKFLCQLYGLHDDDLQVMRDTLFSAAAYRREGQAALERTTRQTRQPFYDELYEMVNPYFDIFGDEVHVEDAPDQPDQWEQPWFFLVISRVGQSPQVDAKLLRQAMKEANKESASRIIIHVPNHGGLLIGLLNQRRWWTVTRATLCGQTVNRLHFNAFGFPE